MKYLTAHPLGVWSSLLLSSALVFFVSCQKTPPTSNGNARGYITSLDSGCSPSNTHGIWYNGVAAGTDSNYLAVTLNVTTPGKYAISTDSQNGVSFSGSGSFNEIGLYTVHLKSSGAFSHYGPTSFAVRFDSSSCNFIVYVQDSAARNYPDNTWEATANGRYYKGVLVTGWGLNGPPGQATSFSLSGSAAPVPTEHTSMSMGITPGGIIDTIPYQTNQNGISFFISSYDSAKAFPDNYILEGFAFKGEVGNPLMTLQIKSMVPQVTDGVYKTVVWGTFSGTVRDYWHQYHIEPVVNGKFKLVN